MNENFEVLSALVDGEDVDVTELELALEVPAGRRALVEFVKVRHVLDVDGERPSESYYLHARSLLTTRRPAAKRWRLSIAAAAILLGFVAGALVGPRLIGPLQPAVATRLPEPARVLTFEAGVDWNRVEAP